MHLLDITQLVLNVGSSLVKFRRFDENLRVKSGWSRSAAPDKQNFTPRRFIRTRSNISTV